MRYIEIEKRINCAACGYPFSRYDELCCPQAWKYIKEYICQVCASWSWFEFVAARVRNTK